MRLIPREDYDPALALFRNSPHQMKLTALAEGRIGARVWADAREPSVCAVVYQNKLLVASPLDAAPLSAILRPFLLEQAYEKRMGCGANEALVFWDGAGVREALLTALSDRHPAYSMREYWELDGQTRRGQEAAPEGYALLAVDQPALERGYENTDRLTEEMCSERVSVGAFLAESFGVCAVTGNELAGWCLSEYNCSEGCEVGIEVVDGHRRKRLALAMVSAFAAEALGRGVRRIGWHCFQSNVASSSTARSAGFSKVLEYGELLCFFEPAVQFAVNGNFADSAGDYAAAAEWYARSVEEGSAPHWAHMRLAMALVSLGRADEAFSALDRGIRLGFNNWGWLRAEPRLEPLRAEDRWKQLF